MRRTLLLLALLGTACSGGVEERPNVILITLDTVRADHLGCYGYPKPTTPNLDRFAEGATRYERCVATAPWTVPTHASLFTGRHPFEHGAHSFEIFAEEDNVYRLSDAHTTLAEVLKESGYATAGFVANAVYLNRRYNLNQGFDEWNVDRVRADRLSAKALEWAWLRKDDPYFLFINYLDAHRPYDTSAVEGEEEYPPTQQSSVLLGQLRRQVMVEGQPPGELGELVVEQYDRAIRNLDLALGELFDQLEKMGQLDRTLVIVTSDHGEYFGEHGLVEHSKDVYEEALSVPLIVKRPGQVRGDVESTVASSVDIPRIVLDALPAELADRWRDAFPFAPGDHTVIAENYYSRIPELLDPTYGDRFRRERAVLYDGPWKYVHSTDGAHELYHLEDDPKEARNRVADEPDVVARLEERWKSLVESGRWKEGESAGPLDPAHLQRMREIGYAGDSDDDGD